MEATKQDKIKAFNGIVNELKKNGSTDEDFMVAQAIQKHVKTLSVEKES